MTMQELVRVHVQEPVATLVLNRPEKRNALSSALVMALSEALAALAKEPSVRVVVLTGAGKVFSAGRIWRSWNGCSKQPWRRT